MRSKPRRAVVTFNGVDHDMNLSVARHALVRRQVEGPDRYCVTPASRGGSRSRRTETLTPVPRRPGLSVRGAAHPGHRRVLDLVLFDQEVEEPSQRREAVPHRGRLRLPLLAEVDQELLDVALLQRRRVERIGTRDQEVVEQRRGVAIRVERPDELKGCTLGAEGRLEALPPRPPLVGRSTRQDGNTRRPCYQA